MAYSEKVMDHYENPRNVGTMDKDAKNVGTGMVGAPACGDVMRLQIQVSDEGVIENAVFKAGRFIPFHASHGVVINISVLEVDSLLQEMGIVIEFVRTITELGIHAVTDIDGGKVRTGSAEVDHGRGL